MKHLIFIFIFLLGSCKSDSDIGPYVNNSSQKLATKGSIYGKWKLFSIDDGKELPYNVWVELKTEKNETGFHILNGKSFINFFYAGYAFDPTTKSFKVTDLLLTEIAGAKKEQDLETEFVKRILEAKVFEINTKGELILKSSSGSKQNMTFKISN